MTPHSYLYVPGDRPEMLAKATAREADALIVDLEDAVAPTRKEEARLVVAAWLHDLPAAESLPEIWIRVNHDADGVPDADLSLAASGQVVGIALPKANTPERLETLASRSPGLLVIPLIESAAGILSSPAIARAPGVVRLAIGEADLAADLGCEPGAEILHPLRMQIVVASAVAGLPRPIGPVTTDFNDLDELRATTRHLRRIGFGARSVIHPAQVRPVNEIFAADHDEIAAARRIVRRAEEARDSGRGVFLADDGRMVDAAVVRIARRLLDEAEVAEEE